MTPGAAQPGPPAGGGSKRRGTTRRWTVVAALAAALATAAVAAVVLWRARNPLPPPPPPPPPPDPRLTYTGPFQNVRPEVGYVGDDRCAECHSDVTRSYHQHPMAHSLTPIAELAPTQSYDAAVNNPFEAFGARFQVERQGDAVRHRYARLGGDGRPAYEDALDVGYAIGSGVHGYSYLTVRDGFVYQTPVSWFEQKHTWGLSPRFSPAILAGRPVTEECLFCHANRTRPVEGTVNRYHEPVFDGYGIGCERCHGPGARHVQNPSLDPADHIDHTIVNPAKLAPALREAVCEQCHLEGAVRVVHRGRDFYDYRPGLPLGAVVAVFVRPAAGGADRKAVNHVEQMYQSGCFRAGSADDRIGCVSCHDPHDYVGPDRRVAYYREACLTCHERKHRSCSVPVAQRRRTSPDDSCIQCHMPPYATSDIAQAASTDHRIPRRPDQPDAPDATPAAAAGPSALATLFYRDEADPRDPEYRRDQALALAAMSTQEGPGREEAAREADALLDEAVQNFPGDAPSWEAKARQAALAGRWADALAAGKACLALAPDREGALDAAAWAARQLGQHEAALGYFRRSVALDPWSPLGRQGLAELLASRQEWGEAVAQSREWVRRAPEDPEARKLLIRCLLKTGDRAGAEAELKTLKALRPGFEADLDHWFAVQQR
jgi:hypothetical protein